MNTKLTLRLERPLINRAKKEASRRGKSVSQMVSDYFNSLKDDTTNTQTPLSPVTASLLGVIKGSKVDESDYKDYLMEKHR